MHSLFQSFATAATLIEAEYLPQSAWHGHIPFAFWIIENLQPQIFVELGTDRGASYCAFNQAIKYLGLNTKSYAVDTWQGDEHAGHYGDEVFAQLSGYHDERYASFSRLIRSTFDEAVDHFANQSIDLIHIDGLHTYEAVKHDFETWLPKLSDKAIVLFHDINVRERGFGVWQLWDELSRVYPHFTFLHCHGLGVLGVGSNLPEVVRELLDVNHDSQTVLHIRDQFVRLGTSIAKTLTIRQQQNDLGHLATEVQNRDHQINQLVAEIQELITEVQNRDRQIKRLTTETQGLIRELQNRDHQISQMVIELQNRDNQIARLYNTISWKLSAPLRKGGHFIHKLTGKILETKAGKGLQTLYTFATFQADERQYRQENLIIQQSGLFDSEFYSFYNTDILVSGFAPLAHFIRHGAAEGRNPNPLFDTAYYLEQYPDVRDSGINPLAHFIRHGAAEGRNPNPLFDTAYYLEQYPDVRDSGINPLAHYISYGALEGRNTLSPRALPFREYAQRPLQKIVYVVGSNNDENLKYRISNYSGALTELGIKSEVIKDQDLSLSCLDDVNLLILRDVQPSNPLLEIIRQFRLLDRPVIFDIDESIGFYQKFQQWMISFDCITTPTFALKRFVEKQSGLPSFVLPNSLSKSDLIIAESLSNNREHRKASNPRVCIGYIGDSWTDPSNALVCRQALLRIFEVIPDVEFHFIGDQLRALDFSQYRDRCRFTPVETAAERYEYLSVIDIHLMPIDLSQTYADCYSETHIVEAALFEIPTVATPISTFAALILHGETGMLANSEEEWFSCIQSLVNDAQLRQRIGQQAKDHFIRRFSTTTTVLEAIALYRSIINERLRIPPVFSGSSIQRIAQKIAVSIVAVLYKKRQEVRYFLESLRRQNFKHCFEVILVDDASPDDSASIVENFVRQMSIVPAANSKMSVRLIKNDVNQGNCKSRNRGIQEAAGDVVIIVDADCMLNQSFITSHYSAYEPGDCDVAIGPVNIETHDQDPLSCLARHEADPWLAEQESVLQDTVNLDSFVNCITRNFSVKRSFLHHLGYEDNLFDEAFTYSSHPDSGFGWEDVEMGYRLYRVGARIRYLNDTASIHVSHPSSTEEASKPIRSLRNFCRLHQKHPQLVFEARQWSIHTYHAIVSWCRGTHADLSNNQDFHYLEAIFNRYQQTPIIVAPNRSLRILTFRWHCPHQYELYKLGHQFTLVTGAGTKFCDVWGYDQRPFPDNACFQTVSQIKSHDYDLAVLHFDENVLSPENSNGVLSPDWGLTFRWFRENLEIPMVAICHGTPQFFGQYDANYVGADLCQVNEIERKRLVDYLGDIPVICNSYQAMHEWRFRNARVIWHGFAPHEYPPGQHDRGVLVMRRDALTHRPHYRGLSVYEDVLAKIGKTVDCSYLHVPNPSTEYYQHCSNAWAVAKYQNYVRELGHFSIYFNPTERSPMPRSRGEAMMAGLVSVSKRNHDVDLFIRNGVNGFYSDDPDELADYILFLHHNPSVRERISIASRQTALDIFNHDRYLSQWSELLKQMVR
jgi:glycosyltransferase involved in cell wall biosynthesis